MARYNKKKGIRITQDMLIKSIAERTSLTQPQVKECIDVMFDLVEMFTLHPDCSTLFEFKLGNIGKLTLKPHSGRKVGTYKRPNNFTKGEMIEEIVEVEEPSYQNLAFDMFPSYKLKLKEISKKRSDKQGWKARNGSVIPIDQEDEV